MAEALAVASVANIIQLVDFGSKVLVRLNEYQTKVGDVPKSFRTVKTELPILLHTLKQTEKAAGDGSLSQETKTALLPVVQGCVGNVEELHKIIDKNLPITSDAWHVKSRKAVSSFRLDRKVSKIVGDIQSHIRTLTYYHAASASSGRTNQSTDSLNTVGTLLSKYSHHTSTTCSIIYDSFSTRPVFRG